MTSKAFRFDWHPHDAFADFAELTAEEIGVLMQIVNLIYIHNRPIDFDPKHIGRSCNITRAKCERIIHQLIHKGRIAIDDQGRIAQKRCLVELENVRKRRETYSKNGRKGAESKKGNQQNQDDGNGKAIGPDSTSTSTDTSHRKVPSTNGFAGQGESGITSGAPNGMVGANGRLGFDIDLYLDDEARDRAHEAAPGWDLYFLMDEYNKGVHNGTRQRPDHARKAFPKWVLGRTKGKPPP